VFGGRVYTASARTALTPSPPVEEMSINTILLDIEGTTTPVDFVYKVLFPYACAHLKDFLKRHLEDEEVRLIIADLFTEYAKDDGTGASSLNHSDYPKESEIEAIVSYSHWLMKNDRKVTPLKTLQGQIWEEGYRRGRLKSEVFPDVAPNMRRWHEQGKKICVYSSGSVLAQKLLFKHTKQGNLVELIHHFFDTNVGHKAEPDSYTRISNLLREPSGILFISDVTAELDAAKEAGFQTLLCIRSGNRPQSNLSAHNTIHSFDQVQAMV
jgi:enolase-phosphatase E1